MCLNKLLNTSWHCFLYHGIIFILPKLAFSLICMLITILSVIHVFLCFLIYCTHICILYHCMNTKVSIIPFQFHIIMTLPMNNINDIVIVAV